MYLQHQQSASNHETEAHGDANNVAADAMSDVAAKDSPTWFHPLVQHSPREELIAMANETIAQAPALRSSIRGVRVIWIKEHRRPSHELQVSS